MKEDWQAMSSKELRRRIKEGSPGSYNWMAATHELSTRKGITPVATLIIALLTLLVAVGAWLFPRNLNEDQIDSSTTEQLSQSPIEPKPAEKEVSPVVEPSLSSSEESLSISSQKIEPDGGINSEAAPQSDTP